MRETLPWRAYRRLSRIPPVGWLKRRPFVHQLRRAVRQSLLVKERGRYAVNELRRAPGAHSYRMRGSGTVVYLRHGISSWPFEEIFRHRVYEPPAEVAAALSNGSESLRIVDLGANNGYFGAYMLSRFPKSDIVAYEPDPTSADVHEACIRANEAEGRWHLVRAIASTSPGRVQFVAEGTGRSRIASEGDADAIELPQEDVLPQLEHADLVKVDIEGGEWPILLDDRFTAIRAKAIVLEYHAHLCPGEVPVAEVDRLLGRAGFRVVEHHCPDEQLRDVQGVAWAVRT